MTTLELRLEPAAAKVFYHFQNKEKSKTPKLTDIFRLMVVMTAEPLWNGEEKFYKTKYDYEELTEVIRVQVCERVGEFAIDFRQQIFIPPHKMKIVNALIIEMMEMEINLTVDTYLEKGAQVRDAILKVFAKYDIDEDSDYKIDRALQMNLRYRRKFKTVENG